MEQIVYLNGSLKGRSEAMISPFDLGFLYGFGLFETMRAYNGRIFRIGRHIDRLERSAEVLGLQIPEIDLEKAAYDTVTANGLSEARVRLAVSPGQVEAATDRFTGEGSTIFISAVAYMPIADEKYSSGYSASLSDIRRNSISPLSQMKTANYLDMILARMRAKEAGFDEALLLNDRGFLAEGSTSNLFILLDGRLITPSVEDGILAGITREAVLELASSAGIEVEEVCIKTDELYRADEALLTNSVIEIMPLVKVDDRRIGPGSVGPVTNMLIKEYRNMVEKELQLQ